MNLKIFYLTYSKIIPIIILKGLTKMNNIMMTFKLPIKVEEKDGWFISSCSILDVFSQGETLEIAKKNIIETLKIFFASCYERGTLEEVLKECGFELSNSVEHNTDNIISKDEYVNIPIPLLSQFQEANHCHV
jgi:predicted RNase H-like HicB family nuclease